MYTQTRHGLLTGYDLPSGHRREKNDAESPRSAVWPLVAASLGSWALIIGAVKLFLLPLL
jgi:hypothetical protein